MSTYAAWEQDEEQWLRQPDDDVYERPMFEVIDDHAHCKCENGNDHWAHGGTASRWIPGYGYVNPGHWDLAKGDIETYEEWVDV